MHEGAPGEKKLNIPVQKNVVRNVCPCFFSRPGRAGPGPQPKSSPLFFDPSFSRSGWLNRDRKF